MKKNINLKSTEVIPETTVGIVEQAMTSVTVNKIKGWFKEDIGQSVQAQRVLVNALAKSIKMG